jgi:hypothetical protein
MLQISEDSFVKRIRNAKETQDEVADYVQEISALFITHKLTSADKFVDVSTPFIRSNIFYHQNLMRYCRFIDEHPNEAELVHDLLCAKSTSYLKEKLRDDQNAYIAICKSSIKKYRLNSEVDLLMASHQYIMAMLLESGVDKSVAHVMKEIVEISKSKEAQIKEFSKLLDNNGYYDKLNRKFPKLVNLYNENYMSFIPVLMTADIDAIDHDEYGLSSVDYEALLELYSKCYEFIGEFIIYIVGLNNIAQRDDFNCFTKGNADIEQKVNQEDKYNRIQCFVKLGEKFSGEFADTLNKVIRNADAHFNVEYDIMSQKIRFINKGKRNTEVEELFLIQLAEETIKVFGLTVRLWEIAYQLQKNRMICDLKMDWNYGKP